MKNKHLPYLTALLLAVSTFFGYAGTIVVTNTNDSGAGSLRQAMTDAESTGPDTIVFNIPTSDPGYNSTTGVWTIQPDTSFPQITNDSTVIDGTTQTVSQGDKNPKGPEIEINGSGLPESGIGFVIGSSNNTIKGFVINRCLSAGIVILRHRNTINGNYIGTDATGSFALPNADGIQIYHSAKHNTIGGNVDEERNLISGNNSYGIYIFSAGTDSNLVIGNYIGTNATGEDTLCNVNGGIMVTNGSSVTFIGGKTKEERNIIGGSNNKEGSNIYCGNGITIRKSNGNKIMGNYIGTDKNATNALYNGRYGILIQECENNIIGGTEAGEGNFISGYKSAGVIIRMGNTKNNVVSGNFIGADPDELLYCEHCNQGIYLTYGAHDNTIGPGNIIKNNINYGIQCEYDSTVRNMITRNNITHNGELGIINVDGANLSLTAPIIMDITSTGVTGTACADCIVEIFSDSLDEGAVFEGFTIAGASGNFTWSGTVTGPFVTATATDTAGNTSEFSAAFEAPKTVYMPSLFSDGFSLDQNIPNPFSGSTEIHYRLKNYSSVRLTIIDLTGRVVAMLIKEYQDCGDHSVTWNGLDTVGKPVPNGIYFFTLEADGHKIARKMVKASR